MTKEEIAAIAKEVVTEVIAGLDDGREKDPGKAFDQMIAAPPEKPQKHDPDTEQRGLVAGRIIAALAATKGDPNRAAMWSKERWGENDLATKSLETGTDTAGGYTVPDIYSGELIELLQAQAVVRTMGPTLYDMPTGTLRIGRQNAGSTATYTTEGANIGMTEPTFDEVVLGWHKLTALVPISNDLLRQSIQNIDAVVRDDLLASLTLREDLAFIRDDGSGALPTGLLSLVDAANQFTANATVNLVNVTSDLANALLLLRNANVRFLKPGWLFAPRTELYLRTARDTNGNFAFKDEMDGGRLFGVPFGVTTQIPINLGVGTDESELYVADFADVAIGQLMNIQIDASDTAAYHDGANVQATFSKDETVIRAIMEHDIALRQTLSLAVVDTVVWLP